MSLRKILKKSLILFLGLIVFILLVLIYFNIPVKNKISKAELGITFSHRYSQDIGLDWRENYLAILDDLEVRKLRIPVYWDLVEKEKDTYDFYDVDWQLAEAEKRGVEVILVIGQKVPRWPECYIPEWIGADNDLREAQLKEFLRVVVERYRDSNAVRYWQVENEPFLKFGVCPKFDVGLLDEEISLVRSADSSRKIIITDSGELSLWILAAKRADVFGTTMYRNVYKEGWGYYVYPIGPRFFLSKKWLISTLIGQDEAIVIELQGEPWVTGWTVGKSLEEQFGSMNEEKLKDNVEYAKQSGFSEIYVWGAEWWYWLKTQKDYPQLWETFRGIMESNK